MERSLKMYKLWQDFIVLFDSRDENKDEQLVTDIKK